MNKGIEIRSLPSVSSFSKLIQETKDGSRVCSKKITDRSVMINAAIEYYIDNIYLSMYVKRFIFNVKSIRHILQIIAANRGEIGNIFKFVAPNEIELAVFNRLQELSSTINTRKEIPAIFDSFGTIDALIGRALQADSDSIYLAKYANLVLAMAGQVAYKDLTIVVPRFLFTDCGVIKSLKHIDCGFLLERKSQQSPVSTNYSWYNIFSGLTIPERGFSQVETFREICRLITLDVTPDITTGLGVTNLPFETVVGSIPVQKFKNSTEMGLFDSGEVLHRLMVNNPWVHDIDGIYVLTGNNIQVGSCEADYTDTVAGSETEEKKTADPTPEPKPNDEATDKTEPAENKAATQDVEPQQSQPTETKESSAVDPGAAPDDTMNADVPRTTLLGLDLELPKDETLDDFLYKLTVANYIDNVATFNHDEVPSETVTMLSKWKNMFLFLVAATETKRFLKELKIKTL